MPFVQSVSTILPPHVLDQERVRQLAREVLRGKVPFLEDAIQLFLNAGVRERRLVRELDEILANDSLGWRNRVYAEACVQYGSELLTQLFDSGTVRADDIDLFITTSCTGFMIPSVDAHLMNRFKFRPDTKRLPLTELGCAAGAIALSRANDYLHAYPDQRVLVLALEFPHSPTKPRIFGLPTWYPARFLAMVARWPCSAGAKGEPKYWPHRATFSQIASI